MKKTMGKIKIIIILFSFLFINCQKKTLQNDSKIENSSTYDENKYKEVNFQVKKLNDNDNNTEMYTFHHYKLVLNSETEKSEIIFNNNSYPISLNFTYDTDINDALRNIRIFENNKGNEIILIPSFGSNDEITYQVILLKNKVLYENVISYSLLSDSSGSKKIEIYEKKGYFNIKIGKVNVKAAFTKQLNSLQKKSTNTKEEKTSPSDLTGMWGVNCQNELTVLDINKNEGFLSLYSVNAIYINLKVEKNSSKNEYILKYASLASQRNYYENELKIVDEDIDKNKPIGKLTILENGKANLDWIGLYNRKKQKLEFVGKDFLLISENGGKTPLILEKCE
jgi:hypothetical protein